MRPLSEALTVLSETAVDIIRRPARLPPLLPAAFEALAREIKHADAMPAEFERTTRAAAIMVDAIIAFYAEPKRDHYWQGVVGHMLPMVRMEAFEALQNEREARGT